MTAMIGFFPGESQIQVALTVCVLYTIALLKCSPYLRNSDFTLHIFTQNAIFLFLLMGYTVNSKLARGLFNLANLCNRSNIFSLCRAVMPQRSKDAQSSFTQTSIP
eukprot:CAMPEP_0175108642 /NCGR_PEP_ID=MMETSP0086_2-20121207/12795_1 /TAXON_ID=136419 /ORGANISM="Unknown Unknown, Strain D1" /LENGTH=105 /DNA_ID=CAMNT_0016385965 /DNA_START=122 /DNA_END=435 /DNA_ORIENTATION=-